MRIAAKTLALALMTWIALTAFPAAAQTVGVPSGGGVASLGIDDGTPRVGTTVRALNTRLTQFDLSLRATTASLTLRPAVYPVAAGVIGASPVWTGPDVVVSSSGFASYSFNPDLMVTTGSDYVLVVEQVVPGQVGEIEWVFADSYADGVPVFYETSTSSWVENSFPDAVFSATFAATPVPTLTTWAMILLGLMLAGGAAVQIQRRRFLA